MSDWLADTRDSYDTVAVSYADQTRDLLAGLPHLRAALRLFAEEVRGPVADVGCGPGIITALLHGLGVDAFGIDLSPAMIALARRNNPGLRFEVGSMTEPLPEAVGGIIAWWSLIHVPDDEVPAVFGHFREALRPDGLLQLGFHVGDETRLKTQGYGGHPMRVHVHLRRPERVAEWLRAAGFTVEARWLLGEDGAVLFARRG
ncbi:class I SAM-dependent DNA methyltransferase [Lentzea flaviverrucosa]|uniref:Methyltransferase domain-containing protein n=1 Tax=Lentzea flaviverrucosa TaxID=200379 RepID=A0A1H9XWQ9_9PSEU|nr:class I SAM-dependent methyltransferase [Lentzea flaviverrucosa]RDI18250.1 methyltransferase family protein [Lentzea flaviverrucosa]SES50187.1 Methyltransferase domain-containing protein [Lentzea flaviverrucosa]